MSKNFGRQAVKDVKAELDDIRRRRGKKVTKPLNPVEEFYKQRGIRLNDLR